MKIGAYLILWSYLMVTIVLCAPELPDLGMLLANHWHDLLLGLSGASVIASVITAMTPTPAPSSRWYRLYRMIERVALVVGKAKDAGLVPRTPTLERLAREATAIANAGEPPNA